MQDLSQNNEQPERKEETVDIPMSNDITLKPEETVQESPPPQPPQDVFPVVSGQEHVLPPQEYKLKILLLFSDFLAILACIYIFMIGGIIRDVSNESFSFISNRMFAFYAVLAITIGLAVVVLTFKVTRSARTRFIRDNEVRQDSNISK